MHKHLAEMGQPVPCPYTEEQQPDIRATYTCSDRSQPLQGVANGVEEEEEGDEIDSSAGTISLPGKGLSFLLALSCYTGRYWNSCFLRCIDACMCVPVV